ncbi:NifU family protein [Clostridium sp. CF012]|nr:NifU family protein [Clostridium sp. CF012]
MMIDKIKKVIEEEVKPQLALHDGDIEVIKVENGIVEIKFLGACKGCPSAKVTIEDVVEKALKKKIPEVKKVIQIYDVSSELWDTYKKIIKKDN